MKIDRCKKFTPITITVETVEEAAQLAGALAPISTSEARDNGYKAYGVSSLNVDPLYEMWTALDNAITMHTGRPRTKSESRP